MQKIFHFSLALVVLLLTASPVAASASDNVDPPHILISEVQVATVANASQEFIELYNPTDTIQAVTGWTVEYKSATSVDVASNWAKKATLGGSIKAHGFYLIAPKSYLASTDAEWTPTLAASAGHVRLKNEASQIVDQLGYGEAANAALGQPAAVPKAGESIERLPGRLDELAGNATDTKNNGADFIIRSLPMPQNTDALIEVPSAVSEPSEDSSSEDAPVEDVPIAETVYPVVSITELLVDPVSPQTDADDEYIELHNGSLKELDLQGYVVRTGSSFHDYFVLPETVIAPDGYAVLYSRQTKLSLTNGGGAVQILAPDGTTLFQTETYGAALPGQSWASFDKDWRWTLQLTPGSPNVLSVAPINTALTAAAKSKAVKTSSKAVAKAKTTTKKIAKPKAKKAVKKKKSTAKKIATSTMPVAATASLQPSTWLIISLAILTIGYALYEFRYDFNNLYHKTRGDYRSGKNAGQPSKRGRDD